MITLLVAVGVYVAILLVVSFAALRPPRSPIFLSPQELGVTKEDVEFESDGIKLKGWWIPHPNPVAVAVLVHGYVMNRAENVALAVRLHKRGFACLVFDTRASGKSGGKQSGVGWSEKRDVSAACRLAESKEPSLPRVLIGSSMGAAACAFAVAEDPSCADALILDSSYHSLPAATLGWWRFLAGPAGMALLAPVVVIAAPIARFNPWRANVGHALKSAGKPVLILHGDRDNLVSVRHAEKNYEAATGNKRLVVFEGASHSEARWTQAERFEAETLSFLEDAGVIPRQNK